MPLSDKRISMVSINSLRFGIWQITLEAQIKSVFFKKSFNSLIIFLLKNLFKVGICLLLAISATFFEGSIPTILNLLLSKFDKKVPSFEPISIIF